MKRRLIKPLQGLIPIASLLACLWVVNGFAANDFNALDSSLGEMSSSMSHLISGHVGKIIALLALAWAIIGSIFKFNIMLVLSLFGVLLLLAFGVSMVDSLF